MSQEDMVNKPKHYQLFPEHNLEIKDINKRILDNMEESGFNITLYEAGWYQQAMQYFERCYLKNGLEDLEKGIVTMQFVVDSMKDRLKNNKEIKDNCSGERCDCKDNHPPYCGQGE